jgi:hypothetical protein
MKRVNLVKVLLIYKNILIDNYKMKFKINRFVQVIVIFILLYFTSLIIRYYYLNKKEGFTSYIRETYRPYLRNIRLFKDKRYNQIKNTFFSFIRKFGLN